MGFEKLKDQQIKFVIDENVQPIAQQRRRIPFRLRGKVTQGLDKIEVQDIIEDSEHTTGYLLLKWFQRQMKMRA